MRAGKQFRWLSALALVGAAGPLSGCSAGNAGAHSRLVAVHNAFEAVGLSRVGHISEGSLPEGQTVRFPMELTPQCYTFVALGGDGARDVDLSIADANGQRVGGDTSHDAQAAVQYCPTARGRYTISVRMTAGAGGYVLSSWSGAPRGGGGTGDVAGGEGTCRTPIALTLGQTVTGDTSRGSHHRSGSCAEGEAPELVYSIQIERRMMLTASAEQDYDGALYLRRQCEDDEESSELACNDDERSGDTRHSRINAVVEPGTYYLFVDGFGNNHGNFSLTVNATDIPSAQEVCQQAPALTPGTAVTGQTSGHPDVFQSSCANHSPGPDRVYRLEIPQESRVQLYQETDYDGSLYLRRACSDTNSEVACNDDSGDTQHSRINTVLPAGTYYVYTDAFQASYSGNYTLQADVAPIAGLGVQGDSCQDAQPLTPGTPLEGNTFAARDDVTAPCGTSTDGYDMVYRLDVQSRSTVRLWLEQADIEQNAVIYVARSCAQGAPNAAVGCRAGAVGADNKLEVTLERGQYFVVVDSAQPRAFGRFRLHSEVEDTQELERLCRAARPLRSGQTVRGDTSQSHDHFHSTCAGSSRSNEDLYRLVVRTRSEVRIAVETTNHDGSVYLRRDCMQQSSEVSCNDDSEDTRHSLIEETLDPGTYTVVVDGFSQNNNGPYTLTANVTPVGGARGNNTAPARPPTPTRPPTPRR